MGWFLILGAFCVFIVVLIATLLHSWYYDLKDKGRRLPARIIKYFLLAIACSMLYWVIGCIWPYDWTYKRSFYDYTQIRFPEKGRIIYKVSSWEFEACSMEVDSVIFKGLLDNLPNNCTYSNQEFEAVGVTDHYNMSRVIQSHYCTTQGYAPACVVFLNDHKTIIFLDGEIHNAFKSIP